MRLSLITVLAFQLFTTPFAILAADAGAAADQQPPASSEAAIEPPTADEIATAYKRWVARINVQSEQYLGAETAKKVHIEILDLDLLSCDSIKNQPNSLMCRVRIESTVGEGQSETLKTKHIVMTRAGYLWVAE